MQSKEEIRRFSLSMPAGLHRELAVEAAKRDINKSELINLAVREFLKNSTVTVN